MRIHKPRLPRGCNPDEGKQVFQNLGEILDKEYLSDFNKYHREAWSILEEQWLKMRKARKALFAADYVADPQFYVDPGDKKDDEKID